MSKGVGLDRGRKFVIEVLLFLKINGIDQDMPGVKSKKGYLQFTMMEEDIVR